MSIQYPFSPKSTSSITPGSFWGISLASGRYGCGIVLDIRQGSRTLFIAGLLDWIGNDSPDEMGIAGTKLLRQGQVHIKTITVNKGMILGQIDLAQNNIEPMLMRDANVCGNSYIVQGYKQIRPQTLSDNGLPILSTWGYNVIVQYANLLDKKQR